MKKPAACYSKKMEMNKGIIQIYDEMEGGNQPNRGVRECEERAGGRRDVGERKSEREREREEDYLLF